MIELNNKMKRDVVRVYKEGKRVAYAGRKVEVKTATKSRMDLRWG